MEAVIAFGLLCVIVGMIVLLWSNPDWPEAVDSLFHDDSPDNRR